MTRTSFFQRLTTPLLIVFAGAAPAAAQGVNLQGMNLQLVPKIGVFTPLAPFGETNELQSTLALGLAGELVLPALPVNLRINLEHATRTDIVSLDQSAAVLGTVQLTAIVGQLVLRPFPDAPRFQPYLLGGGGVKIYDVQRAVATASDLGVAPRSTRPTLHVGGGVDVRFGPVSLLLEVGNYMSSLQTRPDDTRTHHDAFGMLGFRVGLL